MRIYLIRHGETDWNTQRRLQGREDIALNENGARQARACGMAFRHIPVDCIVTSPLQRAVRTAELIAESLNHPEILVDPDFTERDFGKFSGMTPEQYERHRAQPDPHMEDWDALAQRIVGALRRYCEGPCQNVLVVSHGGAINAALAVLSDHAVGTGKTVLKNTCVNVLHFDGESITIEFCNLTPEEFAGITLSSPL